MTFERESTKVTQNSNQVVKPAIGWHTADNKLHLLEAVLSYSPDAIISLSNDARIRTWNRAATAMFGFTEAEAIGAPANLLVPEQCPEGPNGVFDMALNGASVDIETVRQSKDGTTIPVRVRSLQIKDTRDRVIGVTTSFQDLRPQRLAQQNADEQRRVLDILKRTGATLSGELDLEKLVQTATDAEVDILQARSSELSSTMWSIGTEKAIRCIQSPVFPLRTLPSFQCRGPQQCSTRPFITKALCGRMILL